MENHGNLNSVSNPHTTQLHVYNPNGYNIIGISVALDHNTPELLPDSMLLTYGNFGITLPIVFGDVGSTTCENTDNGAVNRGGGGCIAYEDSTFACGNEEDASDFTANSMCCLCGGGTTGVPNL